MQDEFRLADGHVHIVKLLRSATDPDLAHRILLTMQVLADKESDRKALLSAGAADSIRPYLSESHSTEVCPWLRYAYTDEWTCLMSAPGLAGSVAAVHGFLELFILSGRAQSLRPLWLLTAVTAACDSQAAVSSQSHLDDCAAWAE